MLAMLWLGVLFGCGTSGPPACPPRDLRGTLVFSETFIPSGSIICDVNSCTFPEEKIVTLKLQTRIVEYLTSGEDASSPAWAPDGRRIAFVWVVGSAGEIDVMGAQGGDFVPVVAGGHPTWAPDGSRIAFDSERGLESVGVDGGDRRLIDGTYMSALYPSWSPDGTRIAFVGCADGGRCDLYLVDREGGPLTRLTPDALQIGGKPSWSPDGARIAFTERASNGLETGIWVMRSDGSARAKLTETGHSPTWSPDGSNIAYVDGGIFVMNPDGSCPMRIRVGSITSLDWSAVE